MEKSCSKEYTTWGDITGFDSAEVVDLENGEVDDMIVYNYNMENINPDNISLKRLFICIGVALIFFLFLIIIC